jgi:choline transport protein
MLPANRAFVLPEWFAWFANLLGIAYVILTTVLFVFPPELPVTGSNMNYCIVAFAIVLIISMIQWVIDGKKNFTGPKVDIDEQILTAVDIPDELIAPNPNHENPHSRASGGDLSDKEKEI